MRYEVDFTGAVTAREMHERIKAGLNLPDYYGMNMDALWDMLTDLHTPCELCVKGLEALPDELMRTRRVLEEVLFRAQDWHARHGGWMEIELCEAEELMGAGRNTEQDNGNGPRE